MEYMDLLNWMAREGLAIGVATYLVYWMTQRLEKKLDKIVELLSDDPNP